MCVENNRDVRRTIMSRQTPNKVARHVWLNRLHVLVLPPVASWDVVWFLTLIVDPGVCIPPAYGTIGGETCGGDKIWKALADGVNDDEYFRSSEEAHAFLPLFLLVIWYAEIAPTKGVTLNFLPPMCDAITINASVITSILL